MMGDDRVVILCTGDLHLGRYPSRVPPGRAELSVANVWGRVVELAIERRVDLVVLTGDVVDRANRFFEAVGPLEAGIRRLGAAGIKTYAVAGNHDFDVLGEVAQAVGPAYFRLLGVGGRWEGEAFYRGSDSGAGKGKKAARPALNIVGWSFPGRYMTESPLEEFDEGLGAGLFGLQQDFGSQQNFGLQQDAVPTVALLHADLDQMGSPYAPVQRAELAARPVSAWLLGHIHRPGALRGSNEQLILYPGSPQALSPAEPGVHGPWLVSVAANGQVEAAQVALATTYYGVLELDLSEVSEDITFSAWFIGQIRQKARELVGQAGATRGGRAPSFLSLRLVLVGRTWLHGELTRDGTASAQLKGLSGRIVEDFSLQIDETTVVVEKITVKTRPPVDLEELARGRDPVAVLARLLVALDAGGELSPGHQRLFDELASRLGRLRASGGFSPLVGDGVVEAKVSAQELREYVMEEGFRLLDELLSQQKPVSRAETGSRPEAVSGPEAVSLPENSAKSPKSSSVDDARMPS